MNYFVFREHWRGEVSADKWVPVFPVFNWSLVLWKKYFVFLKTTYSSRYSFVACNSGTLSIPCFDDKKMKLKKLYSVWSAMGWDSNLCASGGRDKSTNREIRQSTSGLRWSILHNVGGKGAYKDLKWRKRPNKKQNDENRA